MRTWIALVGLVAATVANAGTPVMFAWEQPNDPEWVIGGYELRIFTNAPTPTSSNWIASIQSSTTNATWDIPSAGIRYWATVVAKDTNGIASDPSDPIGFWKPSKPTLKITPRLQTSAAVNGPWNDCIQLDPMRVELADESKFWRMKMGVELVNVEVQRE